MIVTLAGRRTDPQDALPARFPLEQSASVRAAIEQLLKDHRATALVSSAACGADLLALEVAGRLGIRRRVVLCFAPERFRATSVIDRPGDWGPVYDRVLAELDKTGDVVTLAGHLAGDAAYAAANEAILDEAASLALQGATDVVALLVWEGAPRGDADMTEDFGRAAEKRGYRVEQVKTL